jgi:hypothetical protein
VVLAGLGAVGYALAAGLLVPWVQTAGFDRFAALHVVLAGFVVSTIVAVAIEVLPRFTGSTLDAELAGLMSLATLVGPGPLAYGITRPDPWLGVGAAIEGLAITLLAVALLLLVIASNRFRASFVLYGAAGASALVGVVVGVGAAIGHVSWAWIPTHGAVNLLGFVGLIVFGGVIDLYAPALRSGADALNQLNRGVTALSVAGLAAFLGLATTGLGDPRAGLTLFAAGTLLHTVGSFTRLT